MTLNSTEIVAGYISRLKFDDLPTNTVEQAKLMILDVIGSVIASVRMPLAQNVIKVMKNLGGKPEATIIGEGTKLCSPHAGYVNAILAEEVEYVNHSHTPIVPAALAVGESINALGKDIIKGVVAGYEILTRMKRSIEPSEMAFPPGQRPWWGGTFGAFGAAASAASILALDKEESLNALGYLGVSAPVPMKDAPYDGRPEGNVNWGIHAVWGPSTYSGILAALLAQGGYKGNRSVFDDPTGFWIIAGSDRFEPSALTEGLGKHHAISETFYKRYPLCGQMHSILYVVENVMNETKIKKEDIDQIIVCVPKNVPMPIIPYFAHYEPESPYDAEFSLPCAIAFLIFYGKPSIKWYLNETYKNPDLLAFAKRVTMTTEPKADDIFHKTGKYLNTITIIKKDGARISKNTESPWAFGTEGMLQTKESVVSKFQDIVSQIHSDERVNRIIDTVLNLEESPDASKLMELCIPVS
jgi:2-methylcitrate dehydratase PrpD